jgi:spermidine export protein MdtJ
MREYLFLCVALALNAIANILIKLAATKTGSGGDGVTGALALYLSPWFIGGITCFGLNLMAYSLALQKIPLTVAYPIMVGSGYVIMVLVSRSFLGETLTWVQMIGAVLILAGLVLILPRSDRIADPATGEATGSGVIPADTGDGAPQG